jgi:hypothetical protein
MIRHPTLDSLTRTHMSAEVANDIATGQLLESRRLTPAGRVAFPSLVAAAVAHADDAWLERELRCCGRLQAQEQRQTKTDRILVAVPVTAAGTLAEGTFRRYYLRGVALRAKSEGAMLQIVRGKAVAEPRISSALAVGTTVGTNELYFFATTDLVQPDYNGPFRPNSGLTVVMLGSVAA